MLLSWVDLSEENGGEEGKQERTAKLQTERVDNAFRVHLCLRFASRSCSCLLAFVHCCCVDHQRLENATEQASSNKLLSERERERERASLGVSRIKGSSHALKLSIFSSVRSSRLNDQHQTTTSSSSSISNYLNLTIKQNNQRSAVVRAVDIMK